MPSKPANLEHSGVQFKVLTFFRRSAISCFSAILSMLMFSLPFFVWLQNLLGGGLQTACSTGMWKAITLVLLDVNAWLQPLDSLLVERVSFVVSSPVSDPFRFAFSCLHLISALD